MLTADPDLQPGPCPAPVLDGKAHQAADALAIERVERILAQDPPFQIAPDELRFGVVA
jgi:hypothetical protein